MLFLAIVFILALFVELHVTLWNDLRLLQANRRRPGHALLATALVVLDGRSDHEAGRVSIASYEHGMEVGTLVGTGTDESKAVDVQLSLEGFELCLSEEVGHHLIDEGIDESDLEGPSVRKPRDDGLQVMIVAMLQHVV